MIDINLFKKFDTELPLLPFSASRLKSFKNNKAKFFIDYIMGYPRVSNYRMERGKAVEYGIDQFLIKKISFQDCVQAAKTFYKSATNFLDDPEEDMKQYEMIEPMLNQINNKLIFFQDDKTFISNQMKIETGIYGVPFIGYLDYVFEDDDTVYIVDLKTKDKFMLTHDDKLQMAVYKKAMSHTTHKNIHCSFLLATGKQPKKPDQKVCEFVPYVEDYDYIAEIEMHLKSLEQALRLSHSIDDLKNLFAPKLDDYEWKDQDARHHRKEIWGV